MTIFKVIESPQRALNHSAGLGSTLKAESLSWLRSSLDKYFKPFTKIRELCKSRLEDIEKQLY